MSHNQYLFSISGQQFQFLRRFDDMYRNCEDPHGQSKELDRIDYQMVLGMLSRAIAQPGAASSADAGAPRVLDVGCGLGYFTAQVKRAFPHSTVAGCDISATAVEKARVVAPQCEFFTLDLKDKTPPAASWDVVMALHVLCYFLDEEIDGVVANLNAMVKPGGYVLAGHHLPKKMSFGRFIQGLEDARALFGRHGFTLRLGLDLHNDLDLTYANDPVGRNLYFLVQKNP